MKLIFVAIILIILLISTSCSTTHYLLTAEYTNNNTNKTEQINIPVSEYQYSIYKVGDSIDMQIHTVVFGLKNDSIHNYNPMIPIADTLPIGLCCIAAISPMILRYRGISWKEPAMYIIPMLLFSVGLLLLLTLAPDFSAIGTIIDKTSGIW